MRLKINAENKEPFWMEYEPYYSVGTLARKIEYVYSIPFAHQELLRGSRSLKNWETISELDLKNEDDITLRLYPAEFLLRCQIEQGRYFDYYVTPNKIIKMIKENLRCSTNMSPRIQRRLLGDTQLEDNRSLSYYNINSNSKLVVKYDLESVLNKLSSVSSSLKKMIL